MYGSEPEVSSTTLALIIMSKTGQDRFNDCVAYIRLNIGDTLASDLVTTVGLQQAKVGDELSLGTRWELPSSSQHDAKTQQRRALRALLLCQRVYFSDFWPCMMGVVSAPANVNWLKSDWKDQSCQFWGPKTEPEIRDGIRVFTSTSDDPDNVADEASQGQPSAPDLRSLTMTRATFTGQPTATCYDAVMLWLFKAGLVSLRWLLKYRNANTRDTLTEAFGPGILLWDDGQHGTFKNESRLPVVLKGHVVHICENADAWRGHWMVSTGTGGACGCNNNDEEGRTINRGYCGQLSLDGQFRDYGGKGMAVVINPTQIPGRS